MDDGDSEPDQADHRPALHLQRQLLPVVFFGPAIAILLCTGASCADGRRLELEKQPGARTAEVDVRTPATPAQQDALSSLDGAVKGYCQPPGSHPTGTIVALEAFDCHSECVAVTS